MQEFLPSGEAFEQLAEQVGPILFVVAHQEGEVRGVYVNPAYTQLIGRSRESLTLDPLSVLTAVPLEDRGRLPDLLRRAARGEKVAAELRFTRPGGEVRWLSLEGFPLPDGPEGLQLTAGAAVDLTRARLAESARQEAQTRLAAVFASPSLGIGIMSPEGKVLEANHLFTVMLSQGGDLEKEFKAIFTGLAERGEDFHQVEKRYVRQDHQLVWARLSVTLARDPAGRPQAGVCLVENITGHRRAEEALKQSRERFRLLYEKAPLGYQALDEDGRVLDVNQTWLDMTGYSREEVAGRWFGGLLTPQAVAVFKEVFFALKKGAEIFETELDLMRQDGSHLAVALTGKAATDDFGRFQQAHLMVADTSRRRQAEAALRQSELRYRTLVEQIPAITYTAKTDEFKTKLFLSPQTESILGFSWGDYERNPDIWRSCLHPEDRERVLEETARCQAGGLPFAAEYRMLTPEGRVVWLQDEARLVADVDGQPLVLQGIILDITARKLAETEREKWQTILASTFNAFQDLILVVDRDLRVVMSNWRNLPPIQADRREGSHCYECFLRREAPCQPCHILAVFDSGQARMVERTTDDGRTWEIRAFPIQDEQGQVILVAEHVVDITQRRRAEEALRLSEQSYRLLVGSIPGVVFKGFADWGLEVFDDKVEELTGYPREAFAAGRLKWSDLILPEDRQGMRRVFLQALRTTRSYIRSYRIRHRDGRLVWIQARGQIILNDQGRIDHVIGVLFDITKQKETEGQLDAEKERLAVTLRSIGDGVIATDTDGRIVLMNEVAERLTGWTQAEAIGLPASRVFAILQEQSGERCEDPVNQVIQGGQTVGLANSTMLLSRDHQALSVAASSAPIIDAGGHIVGVVLVFRDITARKQREGELLKMEKLSSLGILAGGIAHDFNNILTGILGNLSLAMLAHQDSDLLLPRLAEAEAATLRARDLVQQLLTFAKGGAPVKEVASLAEIIQESANFACRGSRVRAVFEFAPDLKPAEVDPAQISQVIQNLIINAVQAMPSGGTVRVTAENVALEADSGLPLHPGLYVKIGVQDHGIGIPKAYLGKIFDPYFSTKQKGSGLGLATAYSIVKNHEGYMMVTSEPGKGTVFHLYLPAASREAPARKVTVTEPVAGRGRILVMDDDDTVRRVAGKILTHLGYEADFALDGGEALELYAQAQTVGRAFDAVIMDLTIPGGMGGKEAIGRLLEMAPEARAIVSSGYADDPIMTHFQEYGFKGVIRKPYRVNAFSKELARVLNG